MPNSITLPVQYQEAADLIYKVASLTSILDNGDIKMVGKEIKVKKISVDGPADIARGGAYVGGDATAAYETKTPNYDRARKFSIDALDEEELGGLYMDVLAEYVRTKLAPEIDADRFATFASTSSILTVAGATLSTASDFLTALNVAMGTMDTNEVPTEGRILYAEASLLRAVQALDTTKSRETLASFARVIPVPQGRFYTAITKYDGTTGGQTAGGYIKDGSTGKDINFLIIHPSAILQGVKRTVTPVALPDTDYDSYRVANRTYGIHVVYDNKVNGIYLHKKA
jgi:hypothetical protein